MRSGPKTLWKQVDSYLATLFSPSASYFDDAVRANQQAGLPAIDVSPVQGRFLEFLVRVSGARRILEIGTLGGYSTLWLARALPPDGQIVSLELSPHHAQVARANLRNAGVLDRPGQPHQVEIRVGPAADSLAALHAAAVAPFDLVFIDADKPSYPDYLDGALRLARPGTVLLADNVIREGKVLQADSPDADVQGVRLFLEKLAAHPRLSATALQTVGVKGYDGFALAVVLE